jgi:autophagy-related protein 5
MNDDPKELSEEKDGSEIPASTADDTRPSSPPPSPTPSQDTITAADQIRSANWQGSIPILLTLAPTSLSSTTVPSPMHVLVARNTFLHVGLEDAVRRLHEYAPPSFSFGNTVMQVEEPDNMPEEIDDSSKKEHPNRDAGTGDDMDDGASKQKPDNKTATDNPQKAYPVCWFEDERTNQPLKWQYFVGVLFDAMRHCKESTSGSSPIIPWKITLHFHSYPTQSLLELDPVSGVLTTVERTFRNSLKQALVLVHGSSKVALNLTKQSHQSIWQAIQLPSSNTYNTLFRPILLQEMQPRDDKDIVIIPIRLCLDSMTNPLLQRRWDNVFCKVANTTEDKDKNGKYEIEKDHTLQTLGTLLCTWAPQYFEHPQLKNAAATRWCVAGITPPLSTPLLELWRTLAHPDNFLYIIFQVDDESKD